MTLHEGKIVKDLRAKFTLEIFLTSSNITGGSVQTGGRLQTYIMSGDGAGGESSAAKFKRQMEERVAVRKRRGDSLPGQSAHHIVTAPPPQPLPFVPPPPPQLPPSPPHPLPPQAAPPNSVVAAIAENVG